jgi:hypothetical protein
MPKSSDLVSLAALVETPLETVRAQLQRSLSRLGLPCDRASVTALGAAMAGLAMDHKAVTLHQHAPAPASYAGVMTWVALVKGHFAAEQRALAAWIADWTQDPAFQAWAQPQIAADPFLQGLSETEALWRWACGLVQRYVVGDWPDAPAV